MLKLWRSARGFSAAEATIILSTVSVLAAATAPALGDYIEDARQARAREEVRVIASALTRASGDLLARAAVPGGLKSLDLIVGAGDMPVVGSGVDGRWGAAPGSVGVGSLNDHLVTNAVGYVLPGGDLPPGIKGWHGPYLDRPLGADPWGRRYAVRMGRGAVATIALSAGPDGVINTIDGPNGLVPGGDDIISVLSPR